MCGFDRFAICDAYYVFAVLYHEGQFSKTYQIFGRLHHIGYSPGLSVQNCKLETEESRAVYRELCKRHGV